MPVTVYDSVSAFAKDLPKTAHHARCTDWSGGLDYAECLEALRKGDPASLERSEKFLDRLESDCIETHSQYWEHDRTGYLPCVPSYLAGSPDAMRRLVDAPCDTAPLKVYADLFLSASFTAEEACARGATILALTRKLQMIRPVELWLLMACGDSREEDGFISPMIRLESTPLDLTTASFVMGHPGFVRNLCFDWCIARGAYSCIPFFAHLRERIAPGTHDLYIDNACMSRDSLADPVAWVNAQIKKYLALDSDEINS